MTPSLTIGIPVVSELADLRLAVRSVFAQTHTDWQLIIACDGSPPEVVEAAHAIDDSRVLVVADGAARGLPARLNQISEMSSTALIARMDADDVMAPTRIATQLRYFAEHPDVDLVATGSWIIDEYGDVLGGNTDPGIPSAMAGYLGRTAFCHPSVMFTREWARRFPYSLDFPRAEDKELWLRSAPTSRFARIPERLMFYRIAETRRHNLRKRAAGYASDLRLMRSYWKHIGASRRDLLRNEARVWSRLATLPLVRMPLISTRAKKRRFLPLPETERATAQRVLREVSATQVPGWRDE